MIKKTYSKSKTSCRVTFRLPQEEVEGKEVALLGDFNGWNAETHPMKLRKNGTYSVTVSLKAGQEYRFRYFVDAGTWQNDPDADRLVPNRFGSLDCLIDL